MHYEVGHVEVAPKSVHELSGVTTPAYETFVCDHRYDNPRDASQGLLHAVCQAAKAEVAQAKPKRTYTRKKKAGVPAVDVG